MGLRDCPDCENEISESAQMCPECGFSPDVKKKQERVPQLVWGIAIISTILLIYLIYMLI